MIGGERWLISLGLPVKATKGSVLIILVCCLMLTGI